MREPWLREIDLSCDPAVAAIILALQQASEDLARFTDPLVSAQVFHLRHIAGSLDRLATYLESRSLTEAQFEALRAEHDPGPTRAELLRDIDLSIARAETVMRAVTDFAAPRYIGRERIRVPAIGLMIHMAEHTQRHVGQVISLRKQT